jgi:drug/metabolite transporter (DMT)-like permease
MRRLSGFILTIVSAVSFGVMPILARAAYASGADPVTVLFLRFTIATIIMIAILIIRKIPLPSGRTFIQLMLLGGVGYVGQSMCYFTALTLADASLVALLLYLYPILVAILSFFFLREKINKAKIIALVMALAGSALTIGFSGEGKTGGIILGITAAVIYSIYIVSGSRVMEKVQALPASTVIIFSAALVYSGIVAVRGPVFPTTTGGWLATVGVAVIGTVIAIGTFLAGMERIGPTNASTISTLEPAVTVILAGLLLGEELTIYKIIGGVLILAAVILLTRADKKEGTSKNNSVSSV